MLATWDFYSKLFSVQTLKILLHYLLAPSAAYEKYDFRLVFVPIVTYVFPQEVCRYKCIFNSWSSETRKSWVLDLFLSDSTYSESLQSEADKAFSAFWRTVLWFHWLFLPLCFDCYLLMKILQMLVFLDINLLFSKLSIS